MPDRLAFSLDLLATARTNAHPLTVCEAGHLVVRGNTHWQPEKLTTDLKSLLCQMVETCDE